jgi:hypothetical protein
MCVHFDAELFVVQDTNQASVIQPEKVSLTSIRRTLLRFERAVNKNQDQRSKYPDDPSKYAHFQRQFIDSGLISDRQDLSTRRQTLIVP